MTQPTGSKPPPPKRLVAWIMSEFLLSSARAWARPHGGDLNAAFIFNTVLSANLGYLGYHHVQAASALLGGGDAKPRPISAHAIAQSLSLAYETVRRRTSAMIADGRCLRVPGGLVVSPAAIVAPDFTSAMAEVRRLLDDVAGSLAALEVDLRVIAAMAGAPQATSDAEPSDEVVARIVMDAQIRSLETAVPIFGSMLCAYICTAIIAINTRHLLSDVALVRRYVNDDAPPADDLRRPVSIRELARELDVPFETVRRQVAFLARHHIVLTLSGGGMIVPREKISSEVVSQNHPKLMVEFIRMIGALSTTGYRFAPVG